MAALCLMRVSLLLLLAGAASALNFTMEQLFDEVNTVGWNIADQSKKNGLAPSIMKGRGMVMDIRVRTSGSSNFNADGRAAGVYIYLRQHYDGELGKWRQSTFLTPDDIPGPDADPLLPVSTGAFVGGIYITTAPANDGAVGTIMGGRKGVRLEYNKHAVTGNPETKSAIMLSAFGLTYTGDEANSYSATGAAYVFTGEYYHWTQSTKLRVPVSVDDDDFHFGRCVSIDKQTQDTAAISCPGCDPGGYKTARIADAVQAGSQGRGEVFIYKGSEKTDFKKWTATQTLWPRHNMWYYFGGGFLTIDGSTLVTDACRGAQCIDDPFISREYDAPMTHLFVYVKQEVTGLWSEQQVLTDSIMETERNSKSFNYVVLHDDTIAYGNGMVIKDTDDTAPGAWGKVTKNVIPYAGQVLIWYPNKPNYQITETFRYKADIGARKESNSARFNQHQWSLQQYITSQDLVLENGAVVAPGATSLNMFGKYISISGDRMAIGMRGSLQGTGLNPITALYTRQRQGGMWSQQQLLVDTYEKMGESYGVTLYNSHFAVTGGKAFYKYMSEMAHGKWKCLLVTMFDEFGDGWDTAKLRVDAPDGTYDYYYPTCDAPTTAEYDNHPNPFRFEYCPSMKEQGGMYKFRIVDAEKAKFNWEIEWKVELEVAWSAGSDGFSGKTNITGDIHTELEFYWNPVSLSFEIGPSRNVLPSTVSCSTCPARSDSRRNLYATDLEDFSDDDSEQAASRGLRHAAKTPAPSVSPAPTMAQSDSALAQWEQLVMTTSDPLRPWFVADRTGTYFFLSDLEGKTLLRKETQCLGSATPLTHSCWMNYPDAIPDGEYVARIGGARAGLNAGLHTWHFCGVDGGQGEHLQFKVQHGSCYPVQRFTTSRYCTFKQGSSVVAIIVAAFPISLSELTATQQAHVFTALSQILPHTKTSDFSISSYGMDGDRHLQATIHVTLRPSEHGLDPADFDAISNLEAQFSSYVHDAVAQGVLSQALSASLGADSSGEVKVNMVAFDTAFIASRPRGMVDDDAVTDQSEEVIQREWMEFYTPASHWDKMVISSLVVLTDAISVLGYVAILLCVAYGVKHARQQYLQRRSSLQRGLQSASSSLHEAHLAASTSTTGVASRVQSSLDSFSDKVFALVNGGLETSGEDLERAAIPEVVIPDLKTMFTDDSEAQKKKSARRKAKKCTARSVAHNIEPPQSYPSVSEGGAGYDNHIEEDYSDSDDSGESSASPSSSSEAAVSSSSDDDSDDLEDLMGLVEEQKAASRPRHRFKAPEVYSLY